MAADSIPLVRLTMSSLSFPILLLLATFIFLPTAASLSSLRVGLHASWPPTSLFAEAAEWSSKLQPATFWTFIRRGAALANSNAPTCDRDVYAIVTAARAPDPAADWALAARVMSPRVQAQAALADEALSAFGATDRGQQGHAFGVLEDGQRAVLVSQVAQIGTAVDGEVEGIAWRDDVDLDTLQARLAFEHLYRSAARCEDEAERPTFVLYADPLHSDFLQWHAPLAKAADACRLVYILRFYARSHVTQPGLQGYSVEVALKSTEYMVQDDLSPGVDLFPNCAFGSSGYAAGHCGKSSSNSSSVAGGASVPAAADEADAEESAMDLIDIDGIKKLPDAGLVATAHILRQAKGDALSALRRMRHFTEHLPAALAAAYASNMLESADESVGECGKESDTDAQPSVELLKEAAISLRSHRGLAEGVFINGRHILIGDLAEDIERPLTCLAGIAQFGALLRSVQGGALASRVPHILRAQPTGNGPNNVRVDVTAGGKFGAAIAWFNDIEKDTRYSKWHAMGDSGADFVREVNEAFDENDMYSPRARSGGLVTFRSNMVSLVVALDLASGAHAPYFGLIDSIVRGQMPVRLGIVVVPTGTASTICAGLFYHCLDGGGLKVAADLLKTLRQVFEYFGGGSPGAELSEEIIEMVYMQLRASKPSLLQARSARELVTDSVPACRRLMKARQWAVALGILPAEGPTPWDPLDVLQGGKSGRRARESQASFDVVGVLNGIVLQAVGEDTVPTAVAEQIRIAALLESGVLSDGGINSAAESIAQWVSPDPSLIVIGRLGVSGRAPDGGGNVDTGKTPRSTAGDPLRLPLSTFLNDAAGGALDFVKYEIETGARDTSASDVEDVSLVTVWLVVGESAGNAAVEDASSVLKQLSEDSFAIRCRARLALVSPDSRLGLLLWTEAGSGVLALCQSQIAFIVNGAVNCWENIAASSDLQILIAAEASTHGVAALDVIENGVANSDMVFFVASGMQELDTRCGVYEEKTQARKISSWDQLKKSLNRSGASSRSPLLISAQSQSKSSSQSEEGSPEKDVSIAVVVDPIGKHAVLAASFAESVLEAVGTGMVDFSLLLAPAPNLPSEGPTTLRAVFSKAVYSSTLQFADSTGQLSSPAALFDSLPQTALLTVGLAPPRAWFVAPHSTGHDLDNVILRDMAGGGSTLHAEYVLQSLIVEGSCVDENEDPPQGLQLQMSKPPLYVDTVVMSNLGYFQLKTPTPGRWLLDIAAGRGREVFAIQSVDVGPSIFGRPKFPSAKSAFSFDRSGRISVLVDSLRGARSTALRVVRKQGMSGEALLDPSASSFSSSSKSVQSGPMSDLWQKLTGKAAVPDQPAGPGKPPTYGASKSGDTINIFSVASGHLYERFLKIMMLSVTKHASVPVKFWLLENYLSPTFKKVIPHFASLHGFKVQMVTYRWPSWLREQTEKQRIIWAYKILFLDVLFPLNLHRVIFVDSDQVVRSDLLELMRMDLDGAPYGFTPFCDSRKEVEGFRFWKQGFWKDTLKGSKYRISALFVVDLDRFRETSAGDTLRLIYQSLSADPNSLSNLDQDLPNYASVASMGGAKVVPIYDLPQEWLWYVVLLYERAQVVSVTV